MLRPEAPAWQPTQEPGLSPELAGLRNALSEAHYPEEDPRYPPHDEEAFQEGYPRKGNGGYGSPGQF